MPGTVVPASLQQALEVNPVAEVQQSMIVTVPGYSLADLGSLQAVDPVISEFLPFWRRKARPGREERLADVPFSLVVAPSMGPSGGEGQGSVSSGL